MNNHKYRIGQRVRHGSTGRDFYIVGIKTYSFGYSGTQLIVHENRNEPSRNGFTMWPFHCEVIE